MTLNKANLRDLIAATGLVILLKFHPNHQFFSRVTLKFDGWPWKTIGHIFYTTSSFVHHFNPSVNWNWSYSPETLNSGQNWRFFVLCDLEIWWMTFENNRAPLLYYTKLCASFQIHRWIQIGVTVRNGSIWVKIGNFLSRVTLKFDGWPSKQKGTSSMPLQALCIISYPLVNSNLSYSPETPNLSQIWRFLEPCDLEIWWMTLKNNRAPLLCYFKLCAAFRTHWWIQTGVTIRKRPICVKFDDF